MSLSPSLSVVFGIMVFLMLGCLAGYIAPYWLDLHDANGFHIKTQGNGGLFFSCDTNGHCEAQVWDTTDTVVLAVRCLVVFSGICILVSVICAIVRSCCYRSCFYDVKIESILGVLAALSGIVAVATFAVNTVSAVLLVVFYGWAFYVSACCSGLLLIVSIIALVLSFKSTKSISSSTGYANQGYAMDWHSPSASQTGKNNKY